MNTSELVHCNSELVHSAAERKDFGHLLFFRGTYGLPAVGLFGILLGKYIGKPKSQLMYMIKAAVSSILTAKSLPV